MVSHPYFQALVRAHTLFDRFSNVHHDVKPVFSGHRLVLIYILIHSSMYMSTLSQDYPVATDRITWKLNILLAWWQAHMENRALALPTSLAFLLEHYYTESSLCYESLKGQDQNIVQRLQAACEQQGFCLYLASLKRNFGGSCEDDDGHCSAGPNSSEKIHPIVGWEYETMSLTKVVDLNGGQVAADLEYDESLFIQDELFKNAKPDGELYERHNHDGRTWTTHFYHRTVG